MIIRGMPVIFIILIIIYLFNIRYKDIKCYVIFFSNFILKGFFIVLILFDVSLDKMQKIMYPFHPTIRRGCYFKSTSGLAWRQKIGIRQYSTSKDEKSKDISSKNKRKTLSSPESRSYDDIYAGRGIPVNEPIWVKDNGKERSPFGASWAKDEKDRLAYPSNYSCDYINICDPFNNRKLIKEICKGNRVVYIWTYLPTGICLVGSSSNSVERVISYFEKKYLFLEKRRGVQFLADYGFKQIQLTIIYFNYNKSTARDVKIVEAYFINELNSSLNSQKFVYLPPEPLESVLPFINITNRDTAVPIFIYGPDLKRVLYIFNSKTSLYSEFNIHWNTVEKYLDILDKKLYDYFTFSTQILENSDLDNLLSLNELLDIKTNVDPNIPRRGQRVKLVDTVNNLEYEFYSLSKAAKFIEDTVGSCDVGTLRNNMKNNTIYKKRWIIEKL